MARINIEESIRTDIRFINLALKLGSVKLALGELVWAWMIAQKHFLTAVNDRCIPLNEWQQQECCDLIVEVGLAKKLEKGILMSGAEQQFSWLLQRQIAGEKSSEAKKAAKSQKTKKKKESQRPLDSVERPSTTVNGSQPLISSLSSLFSSLDSNSEDGISNEIPVADDDKIGQKLMAHYVMLWKSKYPGSPAFEPKDTKRLKGFGKTAGFDRTCKLLDGYFAMPDAQNVKRAHDLNTFFLKLTEISRFVDSGRVVTNTEVNQLDKAVTRSNTLEALRRGEI